MENIVTKLGSQTSLSPAMLNVVHGVKQVGLHKIAAQMRGQEEFGLEHAVFELGTKLAYNYLKQQKIASGIRSLKTLEVNGDIQLKTAAGMKEQMLRGTSELFDPNTFKQMDAAATLGAKPLSEADAALRNPRTFAGGGAPPAAASGQGGLMPRPTMPGQNVMPVGGAPGLGAPQTMPRTLPGGGGVGDVPAGPAAIPQAQKAQTLRGGAVGEMPAMGRKSLLGIPQQ